MDGDNEDDASSWVPVHPDTNFDEDHDDDASWPSICSHHGSRYPLCKRFMTRDEQGVPVMGYLQRTLNAQDIPWVMAWLQGEPEGVLWESLLAFLMGVFFLLMMSLSRSETYLSKSMRLRAILEGTVRFPGI